MDALVRKVAPEMDPFECRGFSFWEEFYGGESSRLIALVVCVPAPSQLPRAGPGQGCSRGERRPLRPQSYVCLGSAILCSALFLLHYIFIAK